MTEYYPLTSHEAVCCLIHWNVFNHVMIWAACKDNMINDECLTLSVSGQDPKVQLSPGPLLRHHHGRNDQWNIINWVSACQHNDCKKILDRHFQYLKTIFILTSSLRPSSSSKMAFWVGFRLGDIIVNPTSLDSEKRPIRPVDGSTTAEPFF